MPLPRRRLNRRNRDSFGLMPVTSSSWRNGKNCGRCWVTWPFPPCAQRPPRLARRTRAAGDGPAAYSVVRGSHDPAPELTDRSAVCGEGGSGERKATVRGQIPTHYRATVRGQQTVRRPAHYRVLGQETRAQQTSAGNRGLHGGLPPRGVWMSCVPQARQALAKLVPD
jgi:hypothetical protein